MNKISKDKDNPTAEPVRIAEVLGNATTGGVINWLMNFYRRIDRDKIQFDFYTYFPSPFDDEIRRLGGRVFYYPRVTHVFGAFSTLKKAFKKERYAAVHVHMTTLSFVALAAAEAAGVKHRICHAHSTANRAEGWKWFVKTLIRPLSKVFATDLAGCSEKSIRWMYGKKAASRAVLIHNAIETDRFRLAAEVAAADADGGRAFKTIAFIGRLEKQKNVLFLPEVFKRLREKRKDVRLLIVGSGSERGALERRIAELGLGDSVNIRGWENRVEKYYAETDVLALPSLFEGLPIVAVEAQAAGIPCVLSDNVTREAAVTDLCVFVPLGDVESWVKALENALDTGRRYDADLLKGGPYDIRAEAKRLESYYGELLGEADGERN